MRFGGTPNFSITPFTSSRSLLMVLMRLTCSLTNCAMSLSPVDTTTRKPAWVATRASVPMASSASMPGTVSVGQPSSCTTSWIGSICCTSASGMALRVALYCGYHASRNVGPLASNTHTACSDFTCSRSRFIIATMPWMAPVGTSAGPRKSGKA